MLGAICGDIIGSRFEWNRIKTTEFDLFAPECKFTDDTVLTVAVADSIMSKFAPEDVYRYWCLTNLNRGYGGMFKHWIYGMIAKPYNSFGNGSAMRTSAVGWFYNDIDTVMERAEYFAAITHNHPEGIKGAQAVSVAIFKARTGSTKDEIKQYIEELFNYDLSRTVDSIRSDYKFDETCQGSVPESIICFLESTDYESAVRLAISLGGDADTQAAIAGSIAEAFYGGVPRDIIANAAEYLTDDMKYLIKEFYKTIKEN